VGLCVSVRWEGVCNMLVSLGLRLLCVCGVFVCVRCVWYVCVCVYVSVVCAR